MRFLLKAHIPVEAGNDAVRAGKLGEIIMSIVEEQKPEYVFFSEDQGERTAYLVINMDSTSQIPAFAEPWFLAMDANVEIKPIMLPADLAKAADGIAAAVKKYA